MRHQTWPERVFAKVEKRPDGCWIWTASTRKDGYGQVWTPMDASRQRKLLSAHRVVWEFAKGPIPDGMDLDHLCRVRLCVNPDHLEPVTRGENVLRGEALSALNARKTHCSKGHVLVECDRKPSGRCCSCSAHGRHRELVAA